MGVPIATQVVGEPASLVRLVLNDERSIHAVPSLGPVVAKPIPGKRVPHNVRRQNETVYRR